MDVTERGMGTHKSCSLVVFNSERKIIYKYDVSFRILNMTGGFL